MTADKNFKRRVRERAARTGESYTTARMHLAEEKGKDTTTAVGANPETNAIRDALAHAGVRLSEGMILLAGGGIGAGYIAITHGETGFMIGSRALWWDSPGFVRAACERLNVPLTIKETAGAGPALKNARAVLDAGGRPIIWLDLAWLPYSLLPASWRKGGYHVVTLHGLDVDADRAVVGDRGRLPFTVTASELASARASITSFKNRVAMVEAPSQMPDMEQVAREGIAACAQGLLKGRARTFVLEGFRAWGEALGAAKGKEAWSTLFRSNADRYRALTSIYRFVEQWGGPGLLRPLFADALAEAADITGNTSLDEVAGLYRHCGELWHELAAGALPESVPLFREVRAGMIASKRAIYEKGEAGIPAARRELARLDELRTQAEQEFPISDEELRALFDDLGRGVLAAYEAETEAVRALAAGVGG